MICIMVGVFRHGVQSEIVARGARRETRTAATQPCSGLPTNSPVLKNPQLVERL